MSQPIDQFLGVQNVPGVVALGTTAGAIRLTPISGVTRSRRFPSTIRP